MNYLAIDTSGKSLCVVLCKENKIYSVFDKECGVNHSVALMPAVDKLIEDANFNLQDVDFFVSVVGAGSFTGIRIGISTIKAFCFAYGKPCLSVTSFDTLAYNKQDGKNLAVIDAKHNGYYVCGYNGLNIDLEPCYINGEQLKELSKTYNLLTSEPLTSQHNLNASVVDISTGLINAIKIKKEQISSDVNSLVPLYVRKSQAEEGRP